MRKSPIVGIAALLLAITGCGSTDTVQPTPTTSAERATAAATPLRTTTVAPTTTQSAAAALPTIAAAPTTPPAARNAPAGLVSESTWTGEWPFTVTEGVLMCGTPNRVSFTANRTMYALNGAAKTAGGLEDVAAIWKDSSFPGVKIDIGPMIDKGLALC